MSDEELAARVNSQIARRQVIGEKISCAARAIVPVLLDSGRIESAKPLQELFFELDALEQEIIEFTDKHLNSVLEMLLRKVKRAP